MEARILVIESNPDLRKLFEHLLRSDGYSIEACSDWQAAQEVIAQRLPDIVIYDWDLHNTAGYLWAATLRATEPTARLPVLFICDSPPSRQMGERLDSAGISLIDKPFDIFVFRRRVDALLGFHERAIGI